MHVVCCLMEVTVLNVEVVFMTPSNYCDSVLYCIMYVGGFSIIVSFNNNNNN